MALRIKLSVKSRKIIMGLIESLFDRAKARLLGSATKDKQLLFKVGNVLTLPDIFEAAALSQGVKPDTKNLDEALTVVSSYMDSHKERAKARVLKEVTSSLNDAWAKGKEPDLKSILNYKIADVFQGMTNGFQTVVEAETNNVKSLANLDAVVATNKVAGVEDPTVIFLVVHDNAVCGECKRLHLLSDGITPRAWKLSQVSHGYHVLGSGVPSVAGEHPFCRCQVTTILPGYGFDKDGKISFVEYGYDLHEAQQSK